MALEGTVGPVTFRSSDYHPGLRGREAGDRVPVVGGAQKQGHLPRGTVFLLPFQSTVLVPTMAPGHTP